MKTRIAAFALLAGLSLIAVGCDEKAADKAKTTIDKGTAAAQGAADKAKAAGDAAKTTIDKTKEAAPATTPNK